MLNFLFQSRLSVFKCPSSNRPLKPLNPLIGLTQSLFCGTRIAKSPYLFNWVLQFDLDMREVREGVYLAAALAHAPRVAPVDEHAVAVLHHQIGRLRDARGTG
jgi:hypothetical protein